MTVVVVVVVVFVVVETVVVVVVVVVAVVVVVDVAVVVVVVVVYKSAINRSCLYIYPDSEQNIDQHHSVCTSALRSTCTSAPCITRQCQASANFQQNKSAALHPRETLQTLSMCLDDTRSRTSAARCGATALRQSSRPTTPVPVLVPHPPVLWGLH